MYELEYVKKRKRRKWVAFAGGVSVIVISALSIVAFLGRSVGTFTVSLDTGNVKLTMSQKSDFAETSSYYRVNELSAFHEYTYSAFDHVGHSVIDSEDTDYLLGANKSPDGSVNSMNYFKYTFYLKNVGSAPCRYYFTINILDRSASADGRTLDDALRVMVYENSDFTSHEHVIYGKRSSKPHIDEEGNADYRSPVSIDEADATPSNPFMGYAEMFESDSVILSRVNDHFEVDEVKRYTIVTWLEGFRTSNLQEAPKGAKIKLGVNIDAYEI